MFTQNNITVFETATVRDLMFDGYDDPLFAVIDSFEVPFPMPLDKFGWFYPVYTCLLYTSPSPRDS